MNSKTGPITKIEPNLQTLRVLIIDDHAFVRAAIKEVLLASGVRSITEAGNGREAIEIIRGSENGLDLIFCDLQMPNGDGIETLRALADLKTSTCVVLMSGEDASILSAAANLGKSHGLRIVGQATKPVSAKQVKIFLNVALQAEGPQKRSTQAPSIDDEDIRRGLAAEEFSVVFQPKITIANRKMGSVEALIRWRHSHYGPVSPLDFIAIAEESRTIDLLTDFVLARSLEAQALWKSQGLEIHVAVNISTKSMVHLDLPDRLAATVSQRAGHATTITLEVTEGQLVNDLPTFLDIATRLRLKGFRLAIDDFGTGFSTLEQLSRLPVSELKIDRAFVAGTPGNPRTRAILEASLSLARKLNLTTVCEGAETEAEWNLLAELHADSVQGYYVAKPMAANELIDWYRAWRGGNQ